MLDNLRCMGSEDDIFDCPSNGLDINDCSHAEDAGVECRTRSYSTPSTPQSTPSAPPPEGNHFIFYHMCGSRGGGGGQGVWTPLKNHKNIGFPSNTGLDPLKNHKATKPAFNVEPSSTRQQNAFRWQADEGPLLVQFGSSFPSSKKKIKKIKK